MQVAPNGGDASELETQYNPISDRFLNESIFSESTYLKRQELKVESKVRHKSVDFNANLEAEATDAISS